MLGSANKVQIKQNKAIDRIEQIAAMRRNGLSYAAIGRRVGMSGERVRQILNNSATTVKKEPQIPTTAPPLTTSQVARLLNVHVNTVRRWSNKGILEAYPIGPRGDRRFKREDIDILFVKKSSNQY